MARGRASAVEGLLSGVGPRATAQVQAVGLGCRLLGVGGGR